MHINNHEERYWWRDKIESDSAKIDNESLILTAKRLCKDYIFTEF